MCVAGKTNLDERFTCDFWIRHRANHNYASLFDVCCCDWKSSGRRDSNCKTEKCVLFRTVANGKECGATANSKNNYAAPPEKWPLRFAIHGFGLEATTTYQTHSISTATLLRTGCANVSSVVLENFREIYLIGIQMYICTIWKSHLNFRAVHPIRFGGPSVNWFRFCTRLRLSFQLINDG